MVNVKEFKVRATKYVNGKQEIVVTKHGKPVALLTPILSKSPQAILISIGELLHEAGISKSEIEESLKSVRKRLYGPRRS
ncbi:MAG TPA: hypothetical protein DF383_06615 [Deltaproteobacteria bacterium]|nr:hypothetical protein [Deltaproteobacteria bacterium]